VHGNVSCGEEKSSLIITGKNVDNKWEGLLKCEHSMLGNTVIAQTTIIQDVSNPQNIKGNLNLSIGKTAIDLAVSLSTPPSILVDNRNEQSYTLQYTVNIPLGIYSHVSGSYYLSKPENSYDYLNLDLTTTVNGKPTQVKLGYRLPTEFNQQFMIKSNMETPHLKNPFHILVTTEFNQGLMVLHTVLQCGGNSFQMHGDYNHPNFNLEYTADLTKDYLGARKHSLSLSTVALWNRTLSFKLNAANNRQFFQMSSQVDFEEKLFVTKAFMEAPYLFNAPHKYEFKLERELKSPKTYGMEITGAGFSDPIHFQGEINLQSESKVRGFTKLTGAVGSHYLDFNADSSMGDSSHAALNIESTAFEEGKQLIIDATVKYLSKGLDGEIRMRKKNSINSLNAKVWQTDGTGLLFTNVELKAPDFLAQPMVLNAELENSDLRLGGSFIVTAMGQKHELKGYFYRLNVEVMLHAKSELIPTKNIASHIRYVLEDKKVDLFGMVSYGESTWKFDNAFWFHNFLDFRTHIEFMTPYTAWKRIALAAKSAGDELYVEMFFPVSKAPNFRLKLSGIGVMEEPTWRKFEPMLDLHLPWMSITSYGKKDSKI